MDRLFVIGLSAILAWGIVYLIGLYREIEVHTYSTAFEKFAVGLTVLALFFLAFKYGRTGFAYLLAGLGSGVIVLMLITSGANEEGFIFQQGRGFSHIRLLAYEDCQAVKIRIKDQYIEVEVPSALAFGILKFSLEDGKRLYSMMKNVEIEMMD